MSLLISGSVPDVLNKWNVCKVGKVVKVGKVGKVSKEGRMRE
jgi:hypothetical protein